MLPKPFDLISLALCSSLIGLTAANGISQTPRLIVGLPNQGSRFASSEDLVTPDGSHVRLLAPNGPLVVASYDGDVQDDKFALGRASDKAFLIRALSSDDLYVCSQDESVFLSGLPVDQTPCQWDIESDSTGHATIKLAKSGLFLTLEQSKPSLQAAQGTVFVLEGSHGQLGKRQTVPYLEIRKTFPYNPRFVLGILGLRLYSTTGSLVSITSSMFTSSQPFTSSVSLLNAASFGTGFELQPTVVAAGQTPPATVDYFIRITFSSTFAGLSRMELIPGYNQNDAWIDATVTHFVPGRQPFITTIIKPFVLGVIHFPVASQYVNGLWLQHPDTSQWYWTQNNALRPVNETQFVLHGCPRFTRIVDSALYNQAVSTLAPPYIAPTPLSTTRFLYFHADPGYDELININELKTYDRNGVLREATACSNIYHGGDCTTSSMYDRNYTTAHHYWTPITPTGGYPTLLRLTLPNMDGMSRITFFDIQTTVKASVYVQFGSNVYVTSIPEMPFVSFSIPVPHNGQYESGLVIRSAYSGTFYRIENNTRRYMSNEAWEKSGHPRYLQVYDSTVLSLPLGSEAAAVSPSDSDNYIWYNAQELMDVRLNATDGSRIPLNETGITVLEPERERIFVDGLSSTGSDSYRDPGLHIAIPATTKQLRTVEFIPFPSTVYYPRITINNIIRIRFKGLYYEFIGQNLLHSPRIVNFANFTLDRASSSARYARGYYSMVSASFPVAHDLKNDVPHSECPVLCDGLTGCVGYGIETANENTMGCTLYTGDLVGAKPSTTFKTYIGQSPSTVMFSNFKPVLLSELTKNLPMPTPADGSAGNCRSQCPSCVGCDCIGFLGYTDGRLTGCQLINSTYYSRVPSGHSATPANIDACTSNTAVQDGVHAFLGHNCYQIMSPKFVPANIPRLQFIMETVTVYPFSNVLSPDSENALVQIVRDGSTDIRLNIQGHRNFIVRKSCSSCETFRFEAPTDPVSYICVNEAEEVLLSPITSSVFCDWTSGGNKLSIDIGGQTRYLSNITDMAAVTVSTKSARLMFLNFFRPLRENVYLPKTNLTYVGGTVLKEYVGPVTSCSDECDFDEKCVGYSFEGEQNCTLYSFIGTKTSEVGSVWTVEATNITSSLTDNLPWQLKIALAFGKKRSLTSGKGIHIHLVDSGVTVSNYIGEDGFYNDFTLDSTNSYNDANGHGETIAMIIRSIAPAASIHNMKIFNSTGQASSRAFVQGVFNMLQRATNNFRLGRVKRPTILSVSANFTQSYAIDCLMKVANNMNVFLVFAAGNNPETGTTEYWGRMSPASSRAGIVVGSYDANMRIKNSREGRYVDIYAAGDGFVNPVNPNVILSGTSLAAPQVAAVLAKLLSEKPEYQIMSPIYAYRVIISGATSGALVGTKNTTNNLILSSHFPTFLSRRGLFGVEEAGLAGPGYVTTSSCTPSSVLTNARAKLTWGNLIASVVSPSSEESAPPAQNLPDDEGNVL